MRTSRYRLRTRGRTRDRCRKDVTRYTLSIQRRSPPRKIPKDGNCGEYKVEAASGRVAPGLRQSPGAPPPCRARNRKNEPKLAVSPRKPGRTRDRCRKDVTRYTLSIQRRSPPRKIPKDSNCGEYKVEAISGRVAPGLRQSPGAPPRYRARNRKNEPKLGVSPRKPGRTRDRCRKDVMRYTLSIQRRSPPRKIPKDGNCGEYKVEAASGRVAPGLRQSPGAPPPCRARNRKNEPKLAVSPRKPGRTRDRCRKDVTRYTLSIQRRSPPRKIPKDSNCGEYKVEAISGRVAPGLRQSPGAPPRYRARNRKNEPKLGVSPSKPGRTRDRCRKDVMRYTLSIQRRGPSRKVPKDGNCG
ncbi:serine/arginine repetitive matrix protein 1-like [Octopus sinensis]|uniref:Serine/arginine repetitive matrix protein 1-like n=1 Tax=Octopus sinensis TaxID=2607531 RepID=A0A6P7U3Y3_9MOLL|nr:serine/arginine repetitive matrix protein 1-like [Octopus sinensis]